MVAKILAFTSQIAAQRRRFEALGKLQAGNKPRSVGLDVSGAAAEGLLTTTLVWHDAATPDGLPGNSTTSEPQIFPFDSPAKRGLFYGRCARTF